MTNPQIFIDLIIDNGKSFLKLNNLGNENAHDLVLTIDSEATIESISNRFSSTYIGFANNGSQLKIGDTVSINNKTLILEIPEFHNDIGSQILLELKLVDENQVIGNGWDISAVFDEGSSKALIYDPEPDINLVYLREVVYKNPESILLYGAIYGGYLVVFILYIKRVRFSRDRRFLKLEGKEKEFERKKFIDELVKIKKEFCLEVIRPEHNKLYYDKKLLESKYFKDSNLNVQISIQELIISLGVRNDIIGYNSAAAASYQDISSLIEINKEIIHKIDNVLKTIANEETVQSKVKR